MVVDIGNTYRMMIIITITMILSIINMVMKIKIANDNDDDHYNDDKDDYSCNSFNFKVRTSRFFMELDINNI